MKQMNPALFLFAASLLTMPVFAADPNGSYNCTGYDPITQNNYESELKIVQTGATYNFKWKGLNQDFSGTGLFSKSSSDVIAAEFWDPKNQNLSGVIIYQVKADESLVGTWTYADKGVIGTETCNKL